VLHQPASHAEAAEGLLQLARTEMTGWRHRRLRAEALQAALVHATLATLTHSPATPAGPLPRQETRPVPTPTPRPRHASVADPSWSDPTLADHLTSLTAAQILNGDPGELLAPPPMVAGPGASRSPLTLMDYLRRVHPDAAGQSGGDERATNVLAEAVGAMYLLAAGAAVTVESGATVPLASYFYGADLAPSGELQKHFLRILVSVASRGVYRRDVQRLEGAHGQVMGQTAEGDPWPITAAVFDAVVGVLAAELAGRGIPAETLGQLGTALVPARTVICAQVSA
jgi:hypothetical protein